MTDTPILDRLHKRQKLVNRKEHYENVLKEIKAQITEYFLNEQQPPSDLLKTEKHAEKLIAEIKLKLEG